MHIYLIRHPAYHNPDNIYAFHLPVYLSQEGREHAHRIHNWFSEKGKDNLPIYTSPIVRCVQTAEIIASEKQFVATDKRLIETYCPALEGKKESTDGGWKIEEDHPSRESRESVFKRVLSIFEEKKNKAEECILVSHGDPTTILYYHLTNQQLPEYLWSPESRGKSVRKGDIVAIEIENGEVAGVNKYSV